METAEFLQSVIPALGWYFSAVQTGDPSRPWAHRAHTTIDGLAHSALAQSAVGVDTYFALAGFAQSKYVGEDGKTHRRTQENAVAARATWLDIDCGPGKPYAGQAEGLRAFLAFLRTTSLPPPTYIVSSGNGLHIYWAFTADVPKDPWHRAARVLRALTAHTRMAVDAGLTANIANVLRPVGTSNFKDPSNPKPVRVLRRGPTITFRAWVVALAAAARALGVSTKQSSPTTSGAVPSINDAFRTGTEYPPADAERIADRCATMGAFRDGRGVGFAEPEWYAMLQVLVHTTGGAALSHEWSSGHESYDVTACDLKVERALERKPATCEFIRSLCPATCAGCTVDLNSPISLGFPEPVHQLTVVDLTTGEVEDIPPIPPEMAEDYRWTEKLGLQAFVVPTARKTKGEDGEEGTESYKARRERGKWVTCSTQYPTIKFLWVDDLGEFWARISTRKGPREWYDVDIKGASIGRGGANLMGDLCGRAGVTTTGAKRPLLEAYMQTWYDTTRKNTDPQIMRKALGWQPDGEFLLGNRLYTADGGEPRTIVVSQSLARHVAAHEPHGDPTRYVELIDDLYNRPDRTVYQYVWLSGFASILPALLSNTPVGLILDLVSQKTSLGKTSIARIGIGVWGDPSANGQVAQADGATELALQTMAGQRRHLPVLIDEVTTWEPAKLAKFLYSYSSGVAKLQARAEGGLRDNSHLNWANIMYLSSNVSAVSLLQTHTRNAGPQIARVFEAHFPEVELSLDPGDNRKVESLQRDYYALGGDAFLRHVVPRRAEIAKRIEDLRERIPVSFGLTSAARYWVIQAACTLVAFEITAELGLHAFDRARFVRWVRTQLREMGGHLADSVPDHEEMFAAFIAKINAGLLVTTSMGRSGQVAHYAPQYGPPRSAVTGRIVDNDTDPGAYFPASLIRAWCADARVDYRGFRQSMIDAGWLLDDAAHISVTQGLPIASSRTKCWSIDYRKCRGVLRTVPNAASHDPEMRDVV